MTPMTFYAALDCSDLLAQICLSNDSVAEHLRPDVRKIVFALDAADLILQPQMRHVDVFHFFRVHDGVECVLLLFASMINTGFTTKPKSLIMLSTLFASDAPKAAADSSASALLLAMICSFLIYAFKKVSSNERNSRA